jgi:hypothetical protein
MNSSELQRKNSEKNYERIHKKVRFNNTNLVYTHLDNTKKANPIVQFVLKPSIKNWRTQKAQFSFVIN